MKLSVYLLNSNFCFIFRVFIPQQVNDNNIIIDYRRKPL